MFFESQHLYHIYNQGNNRQQIFFNRDNYLFFLKKMRVHILPYADILAWCLMPNHFHWMVYVHPIEEGIALPTESVAQSGAFGKNSSHAFNHSIGKMLSSYAQAINKEQNRSGSLFRKPCKAICLTKSEGLTPAYFNTAFGTQINIHIPEKEYPLLCFDYIHNNPAKAGLVKNNSDWEFSSYPDYYLERKGTLINKERTISFINPPMASL